MTEDSMIVDVGGKRYKIGRLTAMQQTHIGRRIAPLVATLGLSLGGFQKGIDLSVDDLLPSLGPLTVMLANMKDEDVDYVVATALSVCLRSESGDGGREHWAPVAIGAQIMYADLDMLNMWRLIAASVRFSMGDFLRELLGAAQSKSS